MENTTFDPRLREKHGGVLQGLPLNAFSQAAKEAGQGIRDFAAPEGESWKDVNQRAKTFIQSEIVAKFFQN